MHRGYWKRDASVRPGAWNLALFVLGVAGTLLLLGKVLVSDMFARTRSIGWVTPPGSPSLESGARAQRLFPGRMRGAIVVAVEALPGTDSALSEAVAAFSRNVSARVKSDRRAAQFDPFVVGYHLDAPGGSHVRETLRKELVSKDERTTIILIQPTKTAGSWDEANAFLQDFCAAPPPGYTIHITGMPAVISGDGCFRGVHAKVNTRDMNFELIFKAELCTVPIALLIIGSMVHYVRLLLLPMILVVVSFIVTAALTTPWMDIVPIAHDVPAAVVSVTMAICLDSSLFFLSRFSEQHTNGWSLQRNIDDTTRSIGHTVAVSGTLVAIAFFGSMTLPEVNIQGSGFCMGIAAIACVGTSILVMPSLLLVVGRVLTGTVFRNVHLQPVELSGFSGQREELQEMRDPAKEIPKEHSHWLTMMRFIDRSPVGAIALVMVLMSPVLAFLPELNISADRFALMPMEMPALQALRRVQQDFPVGILEPYAIVVTAPEQGSVEELAAELKAGAETLTSSHWAALAERLGLDSGHAAAVANQVAGASAPAAVGSAATADAKVAASRPRLDAAAKALRSGAAAAQPPRRLAASSDAAPCAALAAVAAGATAGLSRARGAGEDAALDVGLVAANATGCGRLVVLDAAAGAAVALSDLEPSAKDAAGKADHEKALLERALRKGGFHASEDEVAAALGRAASRLGEAAAPSDAPAASSGAAGAQQRSPSLSSAGAVALASVGKAKEAAAAHGVAKDGWPEAADLVAVAGDLSAKEHGALLLPSGYSAMLDLCDRLDKAGDVASMLGPTWALHQRIDWLAAVALRASPATRGLYGPVLDAHVQGRHALLEAHTTFASVGAGGAQWVRRTRRLLAEWEAAHPGFTAELSGGAAEAVDTSDAVMGSMGTYLLAIVPLIMAVVFASFGSLLVPLRLAFALFFTLAATYGVAVVVYQTPLLHGIFPWLAPFDGLTYEVVPMVTGIAIALGLDYDIFLVSRIVEFRKRGFSDRASIFRGAAKAGGVISGAGIIMALAFAGLCFSDKLLMQQFGVLLIVSVVFDTYVVRTILVPALMLVAQERNWWPRKMPPAVYTSLEGEVEDDDVASLYVPMLG